MKKIVKGGVADTRRNQKETQKKTYVARKGESSKRYNNGTARSPGLQSIRRGNKPKRGRQREMKTLHVGMRWGQVGYGRNEAKGFIPMRKTSAYLKKKLIEWNKRMTGSSEKGTKWPSLEGNRRRKETREKAV